MHGSSPFLPSKRPLRAWSVPLALALSLAVAATLAAQKKPPREEEEAPNNNKPKKALHIDEPDTPAAKTKTPEVKTHGGDQAQATGLLQKSFETENREIRELYRDLAYPHDVVYIRKSMRWNVAPLKNAAVGKLPQFSGEVKLSRYDANWSEHLSLPVTAADITGVNYYEEMALQRVNDFLKEPEQIQDDTKSKMTPLARLRAAEDVLATVLSFREAMDHRGLRPGAEIEKALDQKLREVRMKELTLVADSKAYEGDDGGYVLGTRLAESYPRTDPIQVQFSTQMARFVRDTLDRHDYDEVHRRLNNVTQAFVPCPALDAINTELAEAAQRKYREAKEVEDKDPTAARRLLSEAETIDSRLPGLQNEISRLSSDYPILYVGVSRLPDAKHMTPGTACSDAERHAIELMYESLLRVVDDPATGEQYVPVLARSLPKVIPMGREFQLIRDARWSDTGEPVTAADVRATYLRLKERGRTPLLLNVLPHDYYWLLDITLTQGYIDPLSLMTFKIQSARQLNAGTSKAGESGETPVGTGPFQLKEANDTQVVFVANPQYNRRDADGHALPHIREIHFTVPGTNAARDFNTGLLHLLLDVPTSRLHDFETLAPTVSIRTMQNRRIYFLAVNHRKSALGGEDGKVLRQIIANGIDREKILNEVFRKDAPNGEPPHRALYGPFPPHSWADTANMKPFNTVLAQRLASSRTRPVTLTLDYATNGEDDTEAEQACKLISDQLKSLKIDVKVQAALTPEQLRDKVEVQHDYELAYYHYDYPSQAFNLLPLFDVQSQGAGGTNFLGYENDSSFIATIKEQVAHRDFAEFMKLTGEIGDQFHDKVPFVPLWQLDTHVVIHRDLKVGMIDPLKIFPGVEKWKLERGSP